MKRRPATASAARAEVPPESAAQDARRPAPLGRKGWAILGGIILLVNLPVLHLLVRSDPKPSGHVPFSDDFADPGTVARNYRSLGGYPRVINGELLSPGTKNNPLWLDAALPHDDRRTDGRRVGRRVDDAVLEKEIARTRLFRGHAGSGRRR